MRFGVGFDDEYTLEQIGTVLNVTRERIRQIEARAMGKLRRNGSTERLKPLLSSLVSP
jgi:RNA polymerase primary sigma factor